MEARSRGRRPFARPWRTTAIAVAMLGAIALLAPGSWAGPYDTVGADDECFEGKDDFRDLDGNGCPEPIVEASNLRVRFVAAGSGKRVRVKVAFLSLSAPREELVVASCVPACRGRTNRRGGKRVDVGLNPRTFRRGQLVGVRVWRDGYVGRFYGYRITSKRPRYMACLLRTQDGNPKRCHS